MEEVGFLIVCGGSSSQQGDVCSHGGVNHVCLWMEALLQRDGVIKRDNGFSRCLKRDNGYLEVVGGILDVKAYPHLADVNGVRKVAGDDSANLSFLVTLHSPFEL